jgi:uncharacterized protein
MSQSSQRVRIVEFGPKASKPNVIVGVPEAGLVGTIACSYIVEQLKLEERGYIDSDYMPPLMVVHNSVARYPVHLFGKDNLVVVLSEVPLTGRLSVEVAKEVSAWARSVRSNMVIGVTGAPSKEREDSQGEGKSAVVGVGNDVKSIDALKTSGALPFQDGIVSGFYASLLKYCSQNEQSSAILLAEAMAQFPDPAAASAIIEKVNALLSLKIDTKILEKESEGIRMQTRELMQQTRQAAEQTRGAPGAYR